MRGNVPIIDLATTYLLPFLGVMMIITCVHELGHFLVGLWCGVRIETFSIGLGPEIAARIDRSGRRWRIGALPLGGYVRFHEPALTDSAGPAEVGFAGQPVWRRAAIVVAGPVANILLAIAIFTGFVLAYGVGIRPAVVHQVAPDSAAAEAGIQPGDAFLSINGKPVSEWRDIERAIVGSRGAPLSIMLLRGNETLSLLARPRIKSVDTYFGATDMPFLGVGPSLDASDVKIEYYGLARSTLEGAKRTWNIVAATGDYFAGLALGRESADQISGPIRLAKGSGEAARSGLDTLFYLAALFSISIGLVNLLPVPVLDGGRLLYFLIEALRGRPVSARSQEIGFQLGSAFMVALMVLTTFNDVRHLSLG
jgi:regulator of sigma E protease